MEIDCLTCVDTLEREEVLEIASAICTRTMD